MVSENTTERSSSGSNDGESVPRRPRTLQERLRLRRQRRKELRDRQPGGRSYQGNSMLHDEAKDGEQILMYYHDAPDSERRNVYSLSGDLKERHEAYLVDWEAGDEDEIIYDEDIEAKKTPEKDLAGIGQRGRYASDLDDIDFDERSYSDILLQEVVTEGRLNRELVDELDEYKREHILTLADQKGVGMESRGSEDMPDSPESRQTGTMDGEDTREDTTEPDGAGKRKGKKGKGDTTQVEEILWEDGE